MNRDTVIRLARNVWPKHILNFEDIQKLVDLVEAEVRKEIDAAHQQAIAAAVLGEREQCAAICNNMANHCDDPDKCADAIRARAQPAPTGAQKEES